MQSQGQSTAPLSRGGQPAWGAGGWLLRSLAFVAILASAPPAATAQETGTLIGEIVEAGTNLPIALVHVSVTGTGRAAVTDANGRFQIQGLPPGTYEVRIEHIGYEIEVRQVTITAGADARLSVALSHAALGLDRIVVTGTAGAARRREIGNSISQVDVSDLNSPVVGVDQILQGRAAGVSVLPSSGLAGSGAQIRLRGNVSVAMSNQPLIYVDGVRVRSDGYPKNAAELLDRDVRSPNDAIGPLGDINPSDIERIEVIKGAAATTLYGTEAAAGVIQIFTKRGISGKPTWTMQIDQGVDWLQRFGTKALPYLNMEDYLRNAHSQSYSVSIRGGREDTRYFFSAAFDDNQGVLPNDHQEKWSIRGNLDFTPLPNLDFSWNTYFTNNSISNTASGNNGQGIVYNLYTAPAGFYRPEDIPRLLDYEITNDISHLITGVTLVHTPIPALTNRLTVGFDQSNLEARNLRPFGFIAAPEGIIQTSRFTNEILTVDYVGTLRVGLPGGVRGSFSWGAQSVSDVVTNVVAASRNFPGPGEATVSSGSEQASAETRQKVINAGFFGQALFDYADKYFLTLGLRVDGNSAFGEDFGLQAYPKASVSYVISDESFWPESFGSVKLRAAFGEAGRAPGAFDAVRTWNPIGWGGDPALEPLQVGNPNLGPERTKEVELGFDGSFLDDRLTVDFTYYHQTTVDALFPVRQIPSLGFTGSQLENVGKLRNSGIELAVSGTAIEREGFGLNLGLRLSTNHSKVLSLGGATPFTLGQEGWIMEGQPVPVIMAPHVINGNEYADPIVDENYIFGPNVPTHTIGGDVTLRLAGGVQLSLLGEYMGGHYIKNRAFRTLAQRKVAPQCSERGIYEKLENGQKDDVTAYWRLVCTPTLVDNRMFIEKADFFKLRNVTLTLPVPFRVPGATSATLMLSGRNLLQWRNKQISLLDPEMSGNEGMHGQVREIVETIPPVTSFSASLRVVF